MTLAAVLGVALAAEVHVAAMPTVGFDSDDGLGGGARMQIDRLVPGYEPYHTAYVLQGYASVNGYHHHRFRFDRVGIGERRNLRLTGHFAFRQWLNNGYWGLGNGTAVERAYADVTDPDDPARKRYRYQLIQPFARIVLRARLAGPWSVFGTVGGAWTEVNAYDGSLLAEERPYGVDGGPSLDLGAGAIYDTREPELTPDSGVLHEVAVRASPPLPGGVASFVGVFASARGFVHLGPDVVLGSRVMGDYLWGDVPFYDLITWGGFTPVIGMGGSETIRGISFGRWRAPGKVLWNTELRAEAWTQTLFRRELRWQVVPFLDAGAVFGGDDDTSGFPFHPSVGIGLHPIYDRTFAGRIDAAMGVEMIEEADGGIAYAPNVGGYVVFEHVF